MDVKLHDEGCIMAMDGNFVAQVRVDDPELLDGIGSFEDAKEVLLEQMRIVKVMRDDLREKRDGMRAKLIPVIGEALKESAFEWEHARNCVKLMKLRKDLMASDRLCYRRLCREISTDRAFPEDLRKYTRRLLKIEETFLKRSIWLDRFGIESTQSSSENLSEDLNKVLRNGFINHRKELILLAPEYLKTILEEANQNQIILINYGDILRFQDLFCNLDQTIFKNPIEHFTQNWIDSIHESHSIERPNLTNSIFFLLCQSLGELIGEISARSENTCNELLFCDSFGWKSADSIKWKYQNSLTTCLEREYRYIFKLLDHYNFANRNTNPFRYYPLVLNRFSKSAHINETKKLIRYHSTHKNPFDFPDEIYIWYSMVDVVLSEMSVAQTRPWGKFDRFGPIFRYYKETVQTTTIYEVNEIRKITHAFVRYIVLNDQVSNQPLSNLQNELTKELFNINTDLERWLTSRNTMFCFWVEGLAMLQKISHLPGFMSLFEQFLELDSIVCNMPLTKCELVDLYSEINIFVKGIVDLQLEWCKNEPNSENIYCEIVNNSCKSIHQNIFLPQKEYWKIILKHYELKSIKKTSSIVQQLLLLDRWPSSGEALTNLDQLASATLLLKIVNRTIKKLPKTEDITTFDVFYMKLIEPLSRAVGNATSVHSFLVRIEEIENNFPKTPSKQEPLPLSAGESVGIIFWAMLKMFLSLLKIFERCFMHFVLMGVDGILFLLTILMLFVLGALVQYDSKTYVCNSNDNRYWKLILTFFGYCSMETEKETNPETKWFNGRFWV
ncbi:uncharacterized protein LOC119767596 [Culex quinquefasciatus]|uniref:uncharacterized protein LOC119767596 n=1 Tax=Culex quinquefasciatus TaxID=7176 RepID=UPI0018E3BBF2|nr:uncharacterized protein LOC119767596 [Culex quinquefasciatus]XP_038112446.1 uncharacterized protein LOC119767596 [Culex quinquefasciatus]XP_038112448.1 uncharacterized protein LOC119767596 [Culex quinquefasciatus]XP_038112449.1 uncharacterized protein LOC119767596 [Culex quinquefasciatus]